MPTARDSSLFKFPADRMLKIGEALTRELLAKPDCLDENGGSHVRRWKRRSAVRQHVVLVLRWA